MNPPPELSISAVNQKRSETGGASAGSIRPASAQRDPEAPAAGLIPAQEGAVAVVESTEAPKAPGLILPFDPFRLADSLWRHGIKALLCGVIGGSVLFIAAWFRVKPHFTASAQLVRQVLPDSFRASQEGQSYKPNDIPVPVLTNSIMKSHALIERVAKATTPEIRPETILAGLEISMDRKSEVIFAAFTSATSDAVAVSVANRYADEVVKLTKELQAAEASEVNDFLKQQLTRCDIDIDRANEDLMRYAKLENLVDAEKEMDAFLSERREFDVKLEGMKLDYDTLDMKILSVERELAKVSPVAAKLAKAREELTQLLGRYTEQNPLVQDQQERIKALENDYKKEEQPHDYDPQQVGESAMASSFYLQRVEMLSQKSVIREQMKKLEVVREKLSEKLSQLPRKNFESALIRAKRQALQSTRQLLASRQREAQLFMDNSLGSYRVLQEAREDEVKTESRFSRKLTIGVGGFLAGFMLIAGWFIFRDLGDGRVLTPADLRRVTRLPVIATLPVELSNDRAASEAWAFRTWTRLQSKIKQPDSALICGLLSDVDTEHCSSIIELLADAAAWREAAVLFITTRPPSEKPKMLLSDAVGRALWDAERWLAQSSGVVYLEADSQWTWSAEQRSKLEGALAIWSRHSHAIIFVELPPASRPETLLMAEKLPQLIWIGGSGSKPSPTLSETLTTYRHAGCKLLGAMLNKAPHLQPSIINQFAGTAAAFVIAFKMLALQAQEPANPVAYDELPSVKAEALEAALKAPVSLPKETASQAPTSKSMTLGAGDTISISYFGRPEYSRPNLTIGPDGKISYLQASDIAAAGLTIEELRATLRREMGKYYHNPAIIVVPVQLQSRRVYIHGKVVRKGIVTMDRPLTLLEAVGEAGGLETGSFQQNTVELADLGHSFISRNNQRVPVDFEALFQRGDMTHNVLLEPDDYIYFPSASTNEIYVFGNVKSQGTQGLFNQTTITSAITLAGGFTPRAFQSRVLVIRGSIEHPKTYVVDVDNILHGRAKNFRLDSKDIVYVSDKPWSRVEDVLELAINSFLQAAVSTYTLQNIPSFLNKTSGQ